ncbi:hypothetical protein E2C01_017529 [Portunus trituberculatus]|uniref:Uncharacterized protein n=1 Tax=Portunus trituberculatus TaxID=210409 RepID=A0A5B7DSR7_PORTR|nr:hypothetical protein [Portunus trituberculatus]
MPQQENKYEGLQQHRADGCGREGMFPARIPASSHANVGSLIPVFGPFSRTFRGFQTLIILLTEYPVHLYPPPATPATLVTDKAASGLEPVATQPPPPPNPAPLQHIPSRLKLHLEKDGKRIFLCTNLSGKNRKRDGTAAVADQPLQTAPCRAAAWLAQS